ncbi:hypothetical protein QR680_006927 [Steinernema hermaphroditum]|uniref:Uncharacterized protein n=1 Tax=Steinernema hermaphroditum TaxID=289476 RepID=A0AA39HZC7_9BILA|nr:hypothetical protein QR680_006927 [Steinernema hermaphroditum]
MNWRVHLRADQAFQHLRTTSGVKDRSSTSICLLQFHQNQDRMNNVNEDHHRACDPRNKLAVQRLLNFICEQKEENRRLFYKFALEYLAVVEQRQLLQEHAAFVTDRAPDHGAVRAELQAMMARRFGGKEERTAL